MDFIIPGWNMREKKKCAYKFGLVWIPDAWTGRAISYNTKHIIEDISFVPAQLHWILFILEVKVNMDSQ